MNDAPFHPDDLAFLLSQDLDGDLSAEQRRRLEEALAASANLCQQAEKFAALDALLGRWAQRRVDLSWDETAGLIAADVQGESVDPALDQVDDLLGRWAKSQPVASMFDVSNAVLAEIRSQDVQVRTRRWVLRLGAPLAMAAAVALVVFGTSLFEPTARPLVRVTIRATNVEAIAASEPPRTVVSFSRTNVDAVARDTAPAQIGFITLGAEPVISTGDASSL